MRFGSHATIALGLCSALLLIAPRASAQSTLQGFPHQNLPDTSTSLGAHARYSRAPINMTSAQLGVTTAVFNAGGGGATFDTGKLVARLTGSDKAGQSELATLAKQFGSDGVASFEKTFAFVVSDALERLNQDGIALPQTPVVPATDAKALSQALYAAGTLPNGKFDDEYMLDSLMTHVVHVFVMNDIDANPTLGPSADATYHHVLFALMEDVKKNYAL